MPRLTVAILCPLFLAIGCQSPGNAPLHPGDAPATQAGERQPAAYKLPPQGIDDDSDFDPPQPFVDALFMPFRVIGDGFSEAFAVPVQMLQTASGDTPRKAVNQMLDKSSADTRRDGLNRLLEFPYTHQPPYTKVYEGMAGMDQDPTVRAAAVRACNRSRDRKATQVFIKGLSDNSEWVRLESAKALANLPDSDAAAPLTNLANNPDENRDVRIAATDALKYYRTLPVARILSGLLSDRDFSVCWQARRSLVYLTNRDYGYDQGAWLGYFVGPEKPIE
jgi:hypothetical protein